MLFRNKEAKSEESTWRAENDYLGSMSCMWERLEQTDFYKSFMKLDFFKGSLKEKRDFYFEILVKNDCH